MRIRKILMYVIFAFIMVLPFSVSAEEIEHDIKFNTSKIDMVDWDYLNQMKLNGYNAVINSREYKASHDVIETYNEFYLNHGYFIAYGSDGELSIYFVFDVDYIDGYIYCLNTEYNNGPVFDSLPEMNNRIGILYYYDIAYSFNNDGTAYLRTDNYNYYTWVDKNINNTDFVYDYVSSDLEISNSTLPDFYYPILATNRTTKWCNVSNLYDSTNEYEIMKKVANVLSISYGSKFQSSYGTVYGHLYNFRMYNFLIKTFNNNLEANNVFRHPYSTEETEKVETNKTSTVISINSSNYTSFRLKYNINSSLKKDWYWWTNPWSYGTDKEKRVSDWLNIQINSTNSISYPRRYTGYQNGKKIEITKMPNDFGNTVLSSSYAAAITSLDGRNGAVEGYFDFDLRDLPSNTIITIYLEYDPEYVQFEAVELPEINLIEYDLTGKYAVGLIPKFTYSNNTFSLLYQGNFTTYYAFNSNNYNVYDSDIIQSLDNYSKKLISFSNFSDIELYEKPIFYIMNNLYTDVTQVSKIKYNPDYFELLVFNSIEDVIISEYTGHSYSSPSQNYHSSGSGINDSNNSSNSTLNFSDLFTKLPDFITGLGSAFTALGTCIMIAFSSLPEMVQSVLWFCLLVSAIVLVIKLLK